MSLKLFLLNTFGGIKATSKIESEQESLWKDYHVYTQVEQSDELNEFLVLKETVSADSFKKLKAELKALRFKGSPEERQLKQFEKLKKNRRLQKYYHTIDSSDLERYQKLKDGDQLNRYFELDKMVNQGMSKTDENAKEIKAEYAKLKSSDDVRFYLKYPRSSVYKNYLRMQNSSEKQDYESLKSIVEADEFKERKAYLDDPQKWEKTAGYQSEQRFESLTNKPEIVLYLKYKDSKAFDFLKKWEIIFEDRFDGGHLDESKWKPINYWAEKTIGKNFSQTEDLQAFNDGKNVHLTDARLSLQVKKEKLSSFVWNPALGFVEREFDYSSDCLTTGGLFQAQFGILEAKIKYDPNKNFQDVFYLAGDDNSLRVNLLESGLKSQLGVSKMESGKVRSDALSLGGLSAGKFYIFRLEWEQGKLSWKINNKEIFTIDRNVPNSPMFLNLASLVIHKTNHLPRTFEVDWIRFYSEKK